MKYLAVTVLIFGVAFSALITGACAYGAAHPQPNELQALGFDLCDGKPCFWGITPGITTYDQATAILSKEYPLKQLNPDIALDIQDKGFVIRRDAGLIDGIYMGAYSSGYSLSDLIKLYGLPCEVIEVSPTITSANSFALVYRAKMIAWLSGTQEISLKTTLDSLEIDPPNSALLCESRSKYPADKIWRGFASFPVYGFKP